MATACGGGPAEEARYDLRPGPHGVEVLGEVGVPAVVVRDEGGHVVQRRAPSASSTVFLPGLPGPGERWTVEVGGQQLPVDGPQLPVSLQLAAPRGQPGMPVLPGARVEAVAVGDGRAELQVVARQVPVTVEVAWGGQRARRTLEVLGEPWLVEGPLASDTVQVRVDDEVPFPVVLDVHPVDLDALADWVRIEALVLPASPSGRADATRPADTLVLPPTAWSAWSGRARDDQAPWTHQGVRLHHRGAGPLDVLVEARIEGPGADAFRPRLRDATGLDRVVASVRLPPHEPVTMALPLYVDRDAIRGRAWTRVVTVTPIGASEPIARAEQPLYLRRAALTTWLGLGLALGTAAAGWGGMAWWGRRWLTRQPTADLMTISLFGALSYVVAGALQVVGHGVSALLGPFAPLLTGLPDAALRACLLATLITLLPRPGVAALATVTGALLRGLTLGSFHPVDLLYVGSTAFWLEAGLYLVGLTRSPAWREAPRAQRWLRTGLGLGLANVGAVATGLCVAAALYRLYYAAWYVVLLLAVPGFLYVLLGCGVAVDLAARLRRVAS